MFGDKKGVISYYLNNLHSESSLAGGFFWKTQRDKDAQVQVKLEKIISHPQVSGSCHQLQKVLAKVGGIKKWWSWTSSVHDNMYVYYIPLLYAQPENAVQVQHVEILT